MCTIIILRDVHPRWPLVIASNRDELFARPASPPSVWVDGVVAPRDETEGGTWMAMSPTGFFTAVTNQRSWGPRLPARESRGQLVLDVVRTGSVAAAHRHLASLDPRRYNPFNLLYGDAAELEVAYGREGAGGVSFEQVPAGIHVLPNDRLDSPEVPKVARIRAALRNALELSGENLLHRLFEVLRSRERRPLEEFPEQQQLAGRTFSRQVLRELDAIAIETEHYGTRSSAVVCLAPGRVGELWYADGPPQKSHFRDLGHLIRRAAR